MHHSLPGRDLILKWEVLLPGKPLSPRQIGMVTSRLANSSVLFGLSTVKTKQCLPIINKGKGHTPIGSSIATQVKQQRMLAESRLS